MAELYSLPDGWEWKKLGKIAKLQNGFAFKSKLFVSDGFKVIKITNLSNGVLNIDDCDNFIKEDYNINFDKYKIKKGDILVAMTGDPKVAVSNHEEELYLNQRVGKINVQNNVLQTYLLYFLHSSFENVFKNAIGAAQKNLSTEQINNIELPLPQLEEQERIVAKLDILFAKIDKAIALHQKNIDEADIFMASVLNDVFVELEEKYGLIKINDVVVKTKNKNPLNEKDTPFYLY